MFWELYQQSKIHEANDTATRAESKAHNVKYEIRRLEDKIETLAMTCQALWEIVRERTNMTDDELVAKVSEIDRRDGAADGKMGRSGRSCEKCGRVLNKGREKCMYCGAAAGKDHVFQP